MNKPKKRVIRRKKKTSKKKKIATPSTKTAKKTINTIPSLKERDAQAIEFKDVMPPVYQNIGWDRLNSMPDYTQKLKGDRLENFIGLCFAMEPAQIQALSKDQRKSILEITTLQQFKKVIATEKDPDWDEDTLKYLHSRYAGKPKDRVEHSGNVGRTLEVKTKHVPDFDSMTEEELEEFQALLEAHGDLPFKEVKDTDNESGK